MSDPSKIENLRSPIYRKLKSHLFHPHPIYRKSNYSFPPPVPILRWAFARPSTQTEYTNGGRAAKSLVQGIYTPRGQRPRRIPLAPKPRSLELPRRESRSEINVTPAKLPKPPSINPRRWRLKIGHHRVAPIARKFD